MTKKPTPPVVISEFAHPDELALDVERLAIIDDLTTFRKLKFHNLSESYSAIDAAIARVASRLTNPRAEEPADD